MSAGSDPDEAGAPTRWAAAAAAIVAAAARGDWSVRLAATTDLAAVREIEAAGYHGIGESAESFIAKVNCGVLVVACVESVVAGYGLALPWSGPPIALDAAPQRRERHPSRLHVHDICVSESYRGRGIASGLMDGFADLAVRLGLSSMTAIAVNGAETLWLALGWEVADTEVPVGYPTGAVAMRRSIHLR
jgi:ribosomal protein S18 acetylase RimI-like enzyme